MAREDVAPVDIAAQGVLAAFDEALELLSASRGCGREGGGGASASLFARLVESWEAEVPSAAEVEGASVPKVKTTLPVNS